MSLTVISFYLSESPSEIDYATKQSQVSGIKNPWVLEAIYQYFVSIKDKKRREDNEKYIQGIAQSLAKAVTLLGELGLYTLEY